MMKKVDEQIKDETMPLLSQNISVIEAGAYSHKFKPLIDFLGVKTLIITDIDGVETSGGKACRSDEAKFTSNSSLKEFFDLPNNDTQFKTLIEKDFNSKELGGNIRIAYQTAIDILNTEQYQPRSFEDAFICANFDYVKSNKDNFPQGLKKRSKFDTIPADYYNLAQDCIDKKSKFAIEILYFDGATDSKSWKVPEYIKEGDVVVLNETKVLNSRTFFLTPKGKKVEVLFLEDRGENTWFCLIGRAKNVKLSDILICEDIQIRVERREDVL